MFVHAYLSMVFVDGFFQADPHPGNIFVESGGTVAMVDFGMVGAVSDSTRTALVEILLALARQDVGRYTRALGTLGIVPAEADHERLTNDITELTLSTVGLPVGQLRLAPLLSELLVIARHHHLRLPRELVSLIKTVVTCEGVAAVIDPGFSLAGAIVPFVANNLNQVSDPPAGIS